jgi:NDP-sugar pyrophosphorylase family protein
MKAMILAAGLGTRLQPITNEIPKALVRLGDKNLLEYAILRLKKFGVSEIIINVHHYAEQIIEYLKGAHYSNITIELSMEDKLLDTGGGLKKAAWFLKDSDPFFVLNVDVITDIDLKKMADYHKRYGGVATLAVRTRKTKRFLLFDEEYHLIGWKSEAAGKQILVKEEAKFILPFSFMGIHAISPKIFDHMPDKNVFSVIDWYIDLAKQGEIIKAFRSNSSLWFDVGRLGNLKTLQEIIEQEKDKLTGA